MNDTKNYLNVEEDSRIETQEKQQQQLHKIIMYHNPYDYFTTPMNT